jgi:uncharacterized protein (DUF1800 family)
MLSDAQIQALPNPSRAEASRFLSHATLGHSLADIDDLVKRGYYNWLMSQFQAANPSHFDWLATKYPMDPDRNQFIPQRLTSSTLRRAIQGADPLRQKMTFALSQIVTLSISVDLQLGYVYFVGAGYYDLLQNHAFGNYGELLKRVSLSPAMARFLTFLGSEKAKPDSPASPDENYARELQQLFSIGVEMLDPTTGIPVINAETKKPYEPYDRSHIKELARVFTGWKDAPGAVFPSMFNAQGQLVYESAKHDTANITLNYPLRDNKSPGVVKYHTVKVLAGQEPRLRLEAAVEGIFRHPNVAFFISKQLIQRFTTSSPSQAYLRRVANVFNNNGAGVKGDLQSVIKAILFDEDLFQPDAIGALRRTKGLESNTFGKLREPFARLVHWGRAFGAISTKSEWQTGFFGSQLESPEQLGQAPLHASSVFNFYRPGYVPPASATSRIKTVLTDGATSYEQATVAPEFQITDEVTTVAYINFMATAINPALGVSNLKDVIADYRAWLPKAASATTLVSDLNLVLAANRLTKINIDRIVNALNAMPSATDQDKRNRMQAAILLVMASPEYLVQK